MNSRCVIALKRLAATNNQLPDDVQYDITNLTRLFSKPHCRVV